ncbi:MAG: hypothetical protein R2852_01845 [Bacteroidia bacterium]
MPIKFYGRDTGRFNVSDCRFAIRCKDTFCKTIQIENSKEFGIYNVFTPENQDGLNR